METKLSKERAELMDLLLTLTPEELAEVLRRASNDPVLGKHFK